MRNAREKRFFAWSVLAALLPGNPVIGAAEVPFVRGGEAGFVVSYIEYGLSPDAQETGACPEGMVRNLQEIHALLVGQGYDPDRFELTEQDW